MASIIKIELNLVPGAAPGGIMPRVRVSQGDAQDRILQFELYDGSEVADLTDVVSIFFGGQKPDGNGFTVLCTSQNNLVTGILTPQSTVLAGLIPCKLYLTTATGSVRSATFDMQIDPDPLNNAGTSDTDITAIVAAAGNYAAEAHQSAEDAAASAETAATAGAAAGQAAAEAVTTGKLDKVGGDSKDVVTTFTSQDNAADTGLITTAGQEVSVATIASGETQSSLFNKITGLALNLRRTISAVKTIWTGVSDDWDQNGHSYSVYDMGWYGTHLYKCKLAHTSSASITPLDTTYWEDTTVTREITSLNSNYAKIAPKLLWTNPERSIAFTAQTITFDKDGSNCDYFTIITKWGHNGDDNVHSEIIKKGSTTIMSYAGANFGMSATGSAGSFMRQITMSSSTQMSFSGGGYKLADDSWNASNSVMVPWQIIGWNAY